MDDGFRHLPFYPDSTLPNFGKFARVIAKEIYSADGKRVFVYKSFPALREFLDTYIKTLIAMGYNLQFDYPHCILCGNDNELDVRMDKEKGEVFLTYKIRSDIDAES